MRAFLALVATLVLPAPALAEPALTPEQIIEFFTRGDPAAGAPADPAAPARSRSLAGAVPGAGGANRSVHVGPTGFGAGAAAAGAASGAPAGPPAAGLDLLVTFDLDSARLTGAALENLDAFVAALADPRLAGLRFAVEGHTDARGPAAYNQGLSERRAEAVERYLLDRGIDPGRLAVAAYGETRPRMADPADPANRRVEARRLP